jgi:hypothetical protein
MGLPNGITIVNKTDLYKQLVFDFDPNIHQMTSRKEFYKYCMIGDVYIMTLDHDMCEYLYVIYQFTDDLQISMIRTDKILARIEHKTKLNSVINEMYRTKHKKTLDTVHEDLLMNYWDYDNVGFWRDQLCAEACFRTILVS